MSDQNTPAVILGGGIAGLTVAWHLRRRGIPFLLLERASRAGGILQSECISGFGIDNGPNSVALTPAIQEMVDGLGLGEQLLYASPSGRNRYLLRGNRLVPVSPHPLKILGTSYLSPRAKWHLFTERFVKARKRGADESVSAFFERRFGKEIAETVIDPVLSGIYAGDAAMLSMREVMRGLLQWEQDYGSVTKGLMKNKSAMSGRKIIGFSGGFGTLTGTIYSQVAEDVSLHTEVAGVTMENEGYLIRCRKDGAAWDIRAKSVICTLPAYAAAPVFAGMDKRLADELATVDYPEVWELHLGFEKKQVAGPLNGFGFLAAQRERVSFLGCIFSSSIFPPKAPEDKVLLTLFIGGAQQQSLVRLAEQGEVVRKAKQEICKILGISGGPCLEHLQLWPKAIPQLNTGYEKIRKALALFESEHEGIFFGGNYVSGVSVGDVVKHAVGLAGRVVR